MTIFSFTYNIIWVHWIVSRGHTRLRKINLKNFSFSLGCGKIKNESFAESPCLSARNRRNRKTYHRTTFTEYQLEQLQIKYQEKRYLSMAERVGKQIKIIDWANIETWSKALSFIGFIKNMSLENFSCNTIILA